MTTKNRVAKIKQKFGATAFKRWGIKGGSPVLKAWRQGKIRIVK